MGTFHVLEVARLLDVQQVLFSSIPGLYDSGMQGDGVNDYTLQHPHLFYGCSQIRRTDGQFFKRRSSRGR